MVQRYMVFYLTGNDMVSIFQDRLVTKLVYALLNYQIQYNGNVNQMHYFNEKEKKIKVKVEKSLIFNYCLASVAFNIK